MVIGTGLIATAFQSYINSPDICIYARGVSDSSCTSAEEFARDYALITKHLQNFSGKLVYFSTCSILDSAMSNSQYVKHKLKIEELIQTSCADYLIVRLPHVAGRGGNKTNVLNYFHNCIKNSIPFTVWSGAKRNVIDIDDVVKIVADAITLDNKTINVANTSNYEVFEIINAFENILNIPALYTTVDRVSEYNIPVSNQCITFDEQYLHRVLTKYYA